MIILRNRYRTIQEGGADTDLMQHVADLAGGNHFNVPGGRTVNETQDDLIGALRKFARKRPVMLVHQFYQIDASLSDGRDGT